MMFQLVICSAAIASVLVLLVWKVSRWVWFEPKRMEKLLREQGYRGNPYKFLQGDMKQMSNMSQEAYSKPLNLTDDVVSRIYPAYLHSLQKYGERSYIWYGPHPAVLIMDPDLAKEVANKFENYPRPDKNPMGKYFVQGLSAYEGEEWAKQRKLLNPAFYIENLKLMIPAFYESASEMLSKWEKRGPTMEVDVWPHLEILTSDVISRSAFGSSYRDGRKIFELQREQTQHFVEAVQSVYVPGLRFLPTKRNRRMKQIAKEVEGLITELINGRLESLKSGEWNGGKDLLGMLLESGMTIKEVIEECKLFYFAGQETTATLLVWTMILLGKFPDWQSRAREEVLHMFGTSGKPDFDKLNQLKIVNMIFQEALRLYTPVGDLFRRTVKETVIGNLTLPEGVLVIIPTMLMHYDSNIWGDDVKEFNPQRFADGVSSATKGKSVFFPFGWGPRICIGQNFAMLEAKLALAMILQRFSFDLSPSYTHAPYVSVTLKPQYGAHLILRKI